ELARTERDQYNKWKLENEAKKSTTSSSSSYKKQPFKKGREEKVPEWFYKRNEAKRENELSDAVNFEQERQKILQKLGVHDG
ncbi:MAG: helicase DnaB, partial [Lysinibacillus sp.]|nr:helicase DnaB [Lysinibacillus sp.]